MASPDDLQPKDLEVLTDAVKSRILDRVLADLRDDLGVGRRATGYTKSDSGIYGKYEKADTDLDRILAAVKNQVDALFAEYQSSASEPQKQDEPPAPKQSCQP